MLRPFLCALIYLGEPSMLLPKIGLAGSRLFYAKRAEETKRNQSVSSRTAPHHLSRDDVHACVRPLALLGEALKEAVVVLRFLVFRPRTRGQCRRSPTYRPLDEREDRPSRHEQEADVANQATNSATRGCSAAWQEPGSSLHLLEDPAVFLGSGPNPEAKRRRALSPTIRSVAE